MARMEQQIVSQAEFRKLRNTALKLWSQHEVVVVLILQYMAHANKLPVRSDLFQLIRQERRTQIDPADYALDESILLGKFEKPVRLLEALASLHSDRSMHAVFIKERLQVPRQKVAPQGRHLIVNPPVLCGCVLPEMLMRIDSDH